MKDLVALYEIRRNHFPLFTVLNSFDWYDGCISGIAKMVESEERYFFETIALQFNTSFKIYTLLEINSSWTERFENVASSLNASILQIEIETFLEQYTGNKFLFKARDIDVLEYDLIKIDLSDLLSYKSIEDLATQSEAERQKWFSFFSI